MISFGQQAYCQSGDVCDTLYESIDLTEEAGFGNNQEAYNKLLQKDIIDAISKYPKEVCQSITSLKIKLVISPGGGIHNMDFLREIPGAVEKDIRNLILQANIWKAGKVNEREVCSSFLLYISCIRWMR